MLWQRKMSDKKRSVECVMVTMSNRDVQNGCLVMKVKITRHQVSNGINDRRNMKQKRSRQMR